MSPVEGPRVRAVESRTARRAAARRAQLRRRRGVALVVALALAIAGVVLLSTGGGAPPRPQPAPPAPATATKAIPAIEAGVLPWSLDVALSRSVVLPGGGASLLVAGGLNASQASVTRVFSIDTATGNETDLGGLAHALHDAAGAVIGHTVTVFGGGSPDTVADVEQLPAPPGAGTAAPAPPGLPSPSTTVPAKASVHGASSSTGGAASSGTRGAKGSGSSAGSVPPTTAAVSVPGTAPVVITGHTVTTPATTPIAGSVVGQLPQPRSDLSAVTVGAVTYVVGGYDGTNPDAAVLATTDATHYSVVASLPIPVRYPAVVALGGRILVLGGEAVGGAANGTAVDAVQAVDPATHSATVVGHLAEPVAGAAAFVLDGNLYLAGGVTNEAPSASSSSGASTTTSTTGAASSTTASAATTLGTVPTSAIWAWDPATHRALNAGVLPAPVAYAGVAVTAGRAWIVGGEVNGTPVSTVEMAVPNGAFGPAGAPGAGSPYYGYKLLVADRGNDRLLAFSPGDQNIWNYPSVDAAAPPGGFYFPDDAFFAKGGSEIISNQEENETIVIIGFPSGQVLWQYGHPKVTGGGVGYLHEPDDAYLLKNGQITVADAQNCRLLFINPDQTVAGQIGTTHTDAVCHHGPPTELGSPNGDTPLADGNVLVSEVNGSWISEYTPQGQLVWTTQLPIHYPSDPQQLGPDLYLVSDYDQTAGAIDEFNREGQLLYRLQPASGLDRMNQPSLTELLPSGVFMTNDDFRDRMVAFDPTTGALVWQYGHPDHPGTAPGYLQTPDGFDLLAPDGSTPTHPFTG